MELVQTVCSILGVIIALYAGYNVIRIKKTIKSNSKISNVSQQISGNRNSQQVGNTYQK